MDNPAESNPPRGTGPSRSVPFYRRYFAQRVIYPHELPAIMRRHIYTGAMGNVWGFLISGIFFVYFGNAVGMSPFDWGLMGGIASFFLTAELLSARLTRQVGQRKVLWFWFAVVSRSVRLLGIVLAYWIYHHHGPHAAMILIASVCLASFFGALSNPPWMSWLADIIPTRKHGRFWARRTWWINISVIFTMLPAAWMLDRMSEEWKVTTAVFIFFAGSVLGLLDLLIHGTIPEPAMVVPEKEDFREQLMEPLRDRPYRLWLTFIALWTFGMTFGGALAMVYFVEDLGLKDNLLAGTIVLTGFGQVGTLLGSRKWGYFVDRFGVKPVLFWGHIGWAILPLFWFFATKDNALYLVALSSLIGGSASNAGVIAANKLITRYPPPGHRVATYTAMSSCVSNVASGFGCIGAGITFALIGPGRVDLWGISLCAFHVLFAASLLMRMGFALYFIPRIQVPEHLEEQASVDDDPEERRGNWASMLRP